MARKRIAERLLVEVGQHQLGALGVQLAGHLGPDSAGTIGDETTWQWFEGYA
jgi:hypothetical protein